MQRRILLMFTFVAALSAALIAFVALYTPMYAGQLPAHEYKVLAPITKDNLTIYPIVAATTHDTNLFLTLDDGIASHQVIVGEAGSVQPLVRRRRPVPVPNQGYGEVNRLVLVNNSDQPLLLLAGEIVTGGKQDRVIGKDRIVPAHSDAVDLSVFCVEPGRWHGEAKFDAASSAIAQPKVRREAMARKDQQRVWDEVRSVQAGMAANVAAAPASSADASGAIGSTTSYARVMQNEAVQERVESVAAPLQRSYEGVMRELRARNAVGVVVAINGRVVWADIFAGPALLQKYWPKLVRSYAAEALTAGSFTGKPPTVAEAQRFVDELGGSRQVVETEPDVFRHAETSGPGYRAFALTSLLPKTGYDIHISKMAE